MLRVLIFVAILAVTIYALIDCIQTASSQVRNLPKPMWLVLIVLFQALGALAWLVAGRSRPLKPHGGFGGRRQPPAGPRGPEDDPDFLRKL